MRSHLIALKPSSAALLWLLTGASWLSASGCGTTCKEIAAARVELMTRPAATEDPHLAVGLPLSRINAVLKARFREVPAQPLKLPKISGVSLGDLSVAPDSLALIPAPEGMIGIRAKVAIRRGNAALFHLTFDTEIKPQLDPARGRLGVALQASDLKSVQADLSPKAADRVTDVIWRQLPKAARIMGKGTIKRAARKIVRDVSKRGYQLLRGPIGDALGTVASFSVQIPDLPLSALSVRTVQTLGGPTLEIGAVTRLGAQAGLGASPKAGAGGADAQLRVAGSALAAMANWALDKALIDSRYTAKGKADPKGEYTPALDWESGADRPLKIHVFKPEGECIHARLGARPTLAMAPKGEVKVGIEDGEIEDVEGPALVELAGWAYALWADAIQVSKSVAGQVELKIAGETYGLSVIRGAVQRDEITLGLKLQRGGAQSGLKPLSEAQSLAGLSVSGGSPCAARQAW